MSNPALLSGSVNSTGIFVQGRVYEPGLRDYDNSINRLVTSPNFFETMEIPILLGRGFTARDNDTRRRSRSSTKRRRKKYFPNENPLGQHFGSSIETANQLEVVGVLQGREVQQRARSGAADDVRAVPADPRGQRRDRSAHRRRSGERHVGRARGRSPGRCALPMMDVSTQLEQVERRFQQEKLFAQACTLFGGLAMLVAAIGLFGLMSYTVSRRTNEIGIRMALGAQRGDVMRQVLRESMILVAVGVAIGVAAAFGTGRFLSTMLFGLAPNDAMTIAAATLVMVAVSALAGFLPARRASRVDPMVALRYD